MNGYQDLNTNIENSRNSLRRIARNDEQEFSRESIVNLMEKFVKTVNVMEETILVPCRLMDRSVGDATDNVTTANSPKNQQTNSHRTPKGISVHENLNSAELFNLYNMLNGVKVDLLWGCNSKEHQIQKQLQADEQLQQDQQRNPQSEQQQLDNLPNVDNSNSSVKQTNNNNKGHVRRPSTASVASFNSTNTLSDTDSDISNENDSGIESESPYNKNDLDKSSELARQYRTHLLGLYHCLEQMTEAANYLTTRYQSDVGPV